MADAYLQWKYNYSVDALPSQPPQPLPTGDMKEDFPLPTHCASSCSDHITPPDDLPSTPTGGAHPINPPTDDDLTSTPTTPIYTNIDQPYPHNNPGDGARDCHPPSPNANI